MKRLFLLGTHIRYSLSPMMHNAALRVADLDWHYALWDLPAEALPEAIAHLRTDECIGANVTIPHKEAIVEWLDELGESASDVGAVNTIVKRDRRLVGENTDIIGFLQALKDARFDPHGTHTVILGAGGAARGVAFALAQAGAASITLVNRTRSRAQALCQDLRRRVPRLCIAVDLADMPANADLVVNSLPARIPLDLCLLRLSPHTVAFDLTYHPPETPFLREAALAGARAVNGLGMLVYQGAASLKLWTGREAPIAVMFDAAYQAMESMRGTHEQENHT